MPRLLHDRLLRIALLIVSSLGGARTAGAAGDTPVVAVFDIQGQSKRFNARFIRQLTDQFRVKLAATKKMIIVDRGEQERELKQLLVDQQKASYKECVDEACQIPLGKMLAAGKLLRTRISRFGKTYVLSSELIDVATGGSADGATVKTDGTEAGMLAAVEVLAGKLTGTGQLEGGSGETVILGAAGFSGVSTNGGESGGKDGIVRFVSEPSGMTVWVSGRKLGGVTPLEDFVKLGKKKIRVGGSGQYKDHESTVVLRKAMNVQVRLEPIVADLVVVVRDTKGTLVRNVPIELDGRTVAKAPARLSRVLVGLHRLKTTTPYGASTEKQVTLTKGTEGRVELVVTDPESHQKNLEAERKRAEAKAKVVRCNKARTAIKSRTKSRRSAEDRKSYCSRLELDDCYRAESNGARVNCSQRQRRHDACVQRHHNDKRKAIDRIEEAISKIRSANRDCRL